MLPIYVFQGMIMFKTLIKPVMLDFVKTNEVPETFFFLLLSFKHRDNDMYLTYEVI